MLIINLTPTSALGKVVRFTDSQGVIHISSAGQEQAKKSAEAGGRQALPAGSKAGRGKAETAGAPLPPDAPPGEKAPEIDSHASPPDMGAAGLPGNLTPINPCSINGGGGDPAMSQGASRKPVPYKPAEDPFLNPSFSLAAARRGSPASGKAISSFQDQQGRLQISNLATHPVLPARGQAPIDPRLPGPLAAVQPAACQATPAGSPPPTPSDRRVGPCLSGEPVIYRYQDHRGTYHITNADPAGKALAAPPPVTRSVGASAPGAARPAAFQGPPVCAPPPARGLSEGKQTSVQSSISTHRDRHGVLHICTAPAPVGASRDDLASLTRLKDNFWPIIAEATRRYRLPPSLVLAVIQMESQFVPGAVSSKGARGLMQLMPATAAELGVRDPFSPRENILAGCRYLRDLLDQFCGSLPLAVAAYNAGDRRVVAAGYAIPAIKETQAFVRSVMQLYDLIEQNKQRLQIF